MAESPPSVPGLTLRPAPLVSDIDALLAMQANAVMHSTAAQTHREFHEGISDILIKARDAHLGYSADCFSKFFFDHGFVMAETTDDTGSTNMM
ncbi:hypothetical protein BGZ70_006347, partial [Mortierella alpina]